MEDWEKSWQNFLLNKSESRFGNRIVNYLNTFDRVDNKARHEILQLYEQLWNYYDGLVPEGIQRGFIEDSFKDYILENLQTHDWKQMAKEIKNRYGDSIVSIEPYSGKDPRKDLVHINIKPSKDFKWYEVGQKLEEGTHELNKIFEFYGYTFSSVNYEQRYIEVEPRHPESATDYVLGKCRGQVYHISPRGKDDLILKSIEKSGLRCKDGSVWDPETRQRISPYRRFPSRVYVFAFEPGTDIRKEIGKRLTVKRLTWDTAAVFKANLWNTNYTFYQDTAMGDDYAFFTYNSIPPELLKRVRG